ncbi:MAG: hypothetical protein K9N48_02280 [Verrucomicrobia bacterium]|nr:hypothetical protein [Verrucomicrobiota bacterium]MCF7708820.1 hypothetical protein [Verrucomicrobiota bacterium]
MNIACNKSQYKHIYIIAVYILLMLGYNANAGVIITNLVSFSGTNAAIPGAAPIQGKDGSYYGVTVFGGPHQHQGTVYRITSDGMFEYIAYFDGLKGRYPHKMLLEGIDNKFYGVTAEGGDHNMGVIFNVTTNGIIKRMLSFTGTNSPNYGNNPSSSLINGENGYLYGTTREGGKYNMGTIYRITMDGIFESLVSFDGTNGNVPIGRLVLGENRYFYGTTAGQCENNTNAKGNVYRMSHDGTISTICYFNGANGNIPNEGLTSDGNGNYYGTTRLGGKYDMGTVYKITNKGEFSTVASFNGNNGRQPHGMLTHAWDGNYYGISVGRAFDETEVYKVTPDGIIEVIVYIDGTAMSHTFTLSSDGNMYGAASHGGIYGKGCIYKMSIPIAPIFKSLSKIEKSVIMTWKSVTGQKYILQECLNMGQNTWTDATGIITATNGHISVSQSIDNDSSRYYRVKMLQ